MTKNQFFARISRGFRFDLARLILPSHPKPGRYLLSWSTDTRGQGKSVVEVRELEEDNLFLTHVLN